MSRTARLLSLSFVATALFAGAAIAAEMPNLALKKPATASNSEQGNPPENAVDGDADTRWCNNDAATGAWWKVDLGKEQSLGGCEITWEHDSTVYKFVIEGSADGKSWTLLNDQRGSTEASQVQKFALAGDSVRYVRITVTGLEENSWASICEVKLFDAATMKGLAADVAKAFHPSAPVQPPATMPAK